MKHTLTTILILLTFAGFSRTVYIDPSKHYQDEAGTFIRPFDSWQDCELTNGNVYLQKCGTTYTSSVQIYVTSHSVTIGSYGTGNRPIFVFTGTGYAFKISASYCYINNFEVNGSGAAFALVGLIGSAGDYGQHNKITNCLLYNAHNPNNAGFGVYGYYNIDPKILNNEIRNVALDGIYLSNTPLLEIGYCYIHDVNRRYFINTDQKYSSGDGIQLDGYYNGFYLHHTIIDRTNGAGNKFGVIFNSGAGTSDKATGIIEYCTFRTDATVSTALHIERGKDIIIRYNHFEGITDAIRLGGRYTSGNKIYSNTFTNCARGVGVGATYPGGYPATGTKVYNNEFCNVRSYHIWIDRATVEVCGNTTDGIGIPEFNYGGGTFKKMQY